MSGTPRQDNRAIVDRQVAAIAKYLRESVWNKKPNPQIDTTVDSQPSPSETSLSEHGQSGSVLRDKRCAFSASATPITGSFAGAGQTRRGD